MNTTSRAILQTVIASDAALSTAERNSLQRLINGEPEAPTANIGTSEHLLVTQKKAAELLSVSRVTVWRMTKECLLHPVEILPGTWRYPYQEIAALGRSKLPVESALVAGAA
jgi:hypothetical protein